MSNLPQPVNQAFRKLLEKRAIPDLSRSYYVRWLSWYWDACQRNHWDVQNQAHLEVFIDTISNRHPSHFLQQQARQAILLFYELPLQGEFSPKKSVIYCQGLKTQPFKPGGTPKIMAKPAKRPPLLAAASQQKSLTPKQQKRVEALSQSIKTKLVDTLKHMISIGQDFNEIKELVGHGYFMQFVEQHFDMSYRTALRFMHVSEILSPHIDLIAGLSQRALYLLASQSVSDHTRQEILHRLEQGEALTYLEIQQHIASQEPESNPASHTDEAEAETESPSQAVIRIKSFTQNFHQLYTKASHGLQGFSGKLTPTHIEQLRLMQAQMQELDGWIAKLVANSTHSGE
ncbi:MAG: hypothetical protein CVV27_00995 [Candidatus Melainabacteria bacterium HGW-Melainabacteria-1]|nr:MAG: hypothetical protein CVV27_00995 [Candidatus Melainabacteria bacterium HGW-Melainabacteria-1]